MMSTIFDVFHGNDYQQNGDLIEGRHQKLSQGNEKWEGR